jgi:hypothetical protein
MPLSILPAMTWTKEPALSRRTWLSLGGAGLAAAALPAFSESRDKGLPVHSVVELFTSQGCSACPPADALLYSMRNDPGLLALSLPVTLWDHLGWKDTLAQAVFSERQKAYAAMRGDRQIYTPQAVVNGLAHCSGADRKSLEAKRRDSAAQPNVLAIMPTLSREGNGWALHLPDSPLGRPAHAEPPMGGATARPGTHAGNVLLVLFQREAVVPIGKGENHGRTARYANVVRSIATIGAYNGAALRLAIPAHAHSDASDSFAVLIQSGSEKMPGPIIGAVEAPRA